MWGELRRDGRGEKRGRHGETGGSAGREERKNNAAGVCGLWWGKQAGRGQPEAQERGQAEKAAAKAARQPWGNGAGMSTGGNPQARRCGRQRKWGRRNGRRGPGKTEAKGYRRRKDDHSRAGSVGSMEPDEPEQRRRPAWGRAAAQARKTGAEKQRCGKGRWRAARDERGEGTGSRRKAASREESVQRAFADFRKSRQLGAFRLSAGKALFRKTVF